MTLDERVAEAAANAKENDYVFESAEAMADDMVMCCADLEDEDVDDVKASIIKQDLLY